jgi:hypothetical protein
VMACLEQLEPKNLYLVGTTISTIERRPPPSSCEVGQKKL